MEENTKLKPSQQQSLPVPQRLLRLLILGAIAFTACTAGPAGTEPAAAPSGQDDEARTLTLPQLDPAELDGRQLRVVATTDVIGDVVQQIGGDHINLTTLMATGQDPHSYEPSTGDIATVARADVIFVNGWGLEEALLETLEQTAEHGPLVPTSAGVSPLSFGAEHDHAEEHEDEGAHDDEHNAEHDAGHDEEHAHGAVDPHVWLDPDNVLQWAENVAAVLGDLDPANAELYQENAGAYISRLEELIDYMQAQTAQIPPEQRKLVVTHDSLGYFAHRFDFDVIGAVIPGSSTLAEPSAGELANLITAMEQAGVCTVFVDTTVNRALAETVAGELATCNEVHIVELYTGSLGPDDSPAGTYIGMMQANTDAIRNALAP